MKYELQNLLKIYKQLCSLHCYYHYSLGGTIQSATRMGADEFVGVI
jgi:hypothetical protein